MADRTSLTKTPALGTKTNAYTANAADLTMAAADSSNKNLFAASGKDLVVAHNTGVGTATVTIDNTGDDDITAYSLGAGEYAIFGPFGTENNWVQTTWKVHLEASSADVKFGVVDLSNF